MSFVAPLAFGLAALALPITVLYILKVRRRRVRVPYLRLWESVYVETRARSLFKRLKRFYSLLLQLAILAALVAALAQPAFELSSVKKESVVLLLDVSASMGTVESEDETRFDSMLERAREIVEGRSFEDEMMIVSVSDRIDVLTPFTRSTLQLRDALGRAGQTVRPLDAERALAFGAEVTSDREHPVVLFLSDGDGGSVEPLASAAESVHLLPIGTATENVGILRFSARKNSSLGTDYVLAVLKNFGESERECRFELSIDGATVKVIPRTLAPGEEITERFQYALAEGATLRLASSEDDAFPVDDVAWAVVRPARLRKVVLVTASEELAVPFWVAFRSMGEVIAADSRAVTVAQYDALAPEERVADVTICVNALPGALPERGNLILMNTPLPSFLPARETGVDGKPSVWDWDREHVLNRYLNYRELPIPAARALALDGGTPLVQSYDGPLVAAFDGVERMVVYVAFDMTAELFPFRLAFPMLLRNAIAWFEIEEDRVLSASYAPGATIEPLRRVPGAAVDAMYYRAGEPVLSSVEVRDGRFYFTETEETGAYLFRVAGENYPTCVNLFDADESDIAPPLIEAGDLYAEEGRHLLNRDLWPWLALIALGFWTAEWALYHRRVTE